MKLNRFTKVNIYFMLSFSVLLIVLPLYITVITAFKTTGESTLSYLTPPSSLYLENFKTVFNYTNYWSALGNTTYITAFVLLGNLMVMPMLSYSVSRSLGSSKGFRLLYYYLLVGIFIPFQVKMIPLVKLMSWLNLSTPTGLAILCIGSSTCESTFLYVGYMQSLPKDIEESAYIDGATTAQTFFRIVFPLMKPILATAMIKDGLWIWNDYMLPLIILNSSPKSWTLTLFSYNFQTPNLVDYGSVFACYILQMLPIMIFYVFMQKYIIGGLAAGAVKG